MSLRTGEQVPRSLEQDDREETAVMNSRGIYGRSQALQSNDWFYCFDGIGNQTYTLPVTVIVTGIVLSVSAPAAAGTQSIAVYMDALGIGTNKIHSISCHPSATVGAASTVFIPVPNWIIEAGRVICADESGGEVSEATFIGYLA